MNELPMISAIMPTSGKRRHFVAQAIKYFQSQDYPNKELIIIDECTPYGDTVARVVPDDLNIHYILLDKIGDASIITIGAKRNLACSLARGDIICHWDDDDYYGPHRLSKQVAPILAGKTNITGMVMSLLLRTADTSLWSLERDVHDKLFGYGVRCGTLMYRSFCWRSSNCAYPNVSRGEDKAFLSQQYGDGERAERIIDPTSYICVRHSDNVTPDIDWMDQPGWEQVPLEQYLSEEDQAFYVGLREGVARV